jgi:acetyl-CoA carboxylase carboxyl transferase subunit beta
MIGFAGPRVIQQATYETLPEGFQTSEFLLKHGLLDMVVPRPELPAVLTRLLDLYAPAAAGVVELPPRNGVAARAAASG